MHALYLTFKAWLKNECELFYKLQMIEDFSCFKFRVINKFLIESLVNPSLYFAKPDTLNDPFDCRLDLIKILKKAESSAIGKQKDYFSSILATPKFFTDWESALDYVGVCSFSSVMQETLLWSHYANEHRGVCLFYQLPKDFMLDEKLQFIGADKVNYTFEPMRELLNKVPMEIISFVNELIKIYLTIKSPAWRYEKEKRIIRREHGAFNIRGEFMKQVCFGLRTPQSDIDLVIKLAQDYCGCTSFLQMVPDESDFGFKMSKL